MPGLRAVLLFASVMSLTLLLIPFWNIVVTPEGDYAQTDTVEYDYAFDLSLEVPTDTDPAVRLGFFCTMWSFVTPDDPAVTELANRIRFERESLDERQIAGFVLRWIHNSIEYVSDHDAHGIDEYWQLPCETLRLGTGDCEDQSLLFVSVCIALGLDAVLVHEPGHVSAAVDVEPRPGDETVELDGRTYVTADPTGSSSLGSHEADVTGIIGSQYNTRHVILLSADVLLFAFLVFFIIRGCRR